MAAIGYLLYGSDLLDEVTTNMIKTVGYGKAVKVVILILVAVVPLTKFPLQ
jgi:vesicular inhibitory amino acid transporter